MSYVNQLIDFIKASPSVYHATDAVKQRLLASGYTEISECDTAGFSDGGKHFVIRGGSSIIAFHGKCEHGGFMICASHSDNPAFKVKSEISASYTRLATEKYGGMIYYSWLDRPLSVAGRVLVRTERGVESKLVNIDKDSFVIPSVAIHMNRTVNEGYKFNPAIDLLPLGGGAAAKGEFMSIVAATAGVCVSDIVSHDLFLYNREEGRVVGVADEYLLSPRLDDLACVYTSLEAFVSAPMSDKSVAVLAVFDNEEVGSETKQGANSTFLDMTLRRIAGSDDKYYSMLADSFMVSADNAHATHPNHPELSDVVNPITLGGGVVVKYNANQRYTTDAVSDAIFRTVAERADVKLQSFTVRADQLCGSTLGSISNTRVSVSTVDIGIPQLAMHSASECAAISDVDDMVSLLTALYSSSLRITGNSIEVV